MTVHERGWVLRLALLAGVMLSIPYLIGYWSEGSDWVFSGFLFGVEDGNSYIAKMMQGSAGAWLFRSPYSTADQAGVLAFTPYLLLGKLASGKALHIQLVALFHIFRIASTLLVAWGTYRLTAYFMPGLRDRRWVTAVALLGGGLGWLIALLQPPGQWLGTLPLDLISPESFGFLAIFGLPHLAMARGLGFLGLAAYLDAQRERRWGWLSGFGLLLAALFQPLTAVTLCLVIAAHQLALAGRYLGRASAQRFLDRAKSAAGAAAVVAPYLLYLTYRFSVDPYLAMWTAQNRILSPHPAHYLAAYLVLLPASLWGLAVIVRGASESDLLLVVWILLLPALAYAPHPVQRRLPEGIWVALAIAAAVGLRAWIESQRARRWARAAVFAAVIPTSALLFLGAAVTAQSPRPPTFLPVEQVRAFRWISAHAPVGANVLSSFETANALPAYAPIQVPVGHGPESINLDELRNLVESFFREDLTDVRAREFLAQHGIDLLIVGPAERALAQDGRVPPYPDLWELAYSEANWAVYTRAAAAETGAR